MARLPLIRLKTERTSAHPWIFAKMIQHPRARLGPGTLVEVQSETGVFVGRGIYHPTQTIGLRLLTEDPDEALDGAFFLRRLAAAKRLREEVLRLPEVTDGYRLVHAEGDGLSRHAIGAADSTVTIPMTGGVDSLNVAAASATNGPPRASPTWNNTRNTRAFFRKLSFSAEKNWHQNSGAKRLDSIRGGGMPIDYGKVPVRARVFFTQELGGLLAALSGSLPKHAND